VCSWWFSPARGDCGRLEKAVLAARRREGETGEASVEREFIMAQLVPEVAEVMVSGRRDEEESEAEKAQHRLMFINGLGFKCAQESVLGEGEDFSSKSLAELEPRPKRAPRGNKGSAKEAVRHVKEAKRNRTTIDASTAESDGGAASRLIYRARKSPRSRGQLSPRFSFEPLDDLEATLTLTRTTMQLLAGVAEENEDDIAEQVQLFSQQSGLGTTMSTVRWAGRATLLAVLGAAFPGVDLEALSSSVEAQIFERCCGAVGLTASTASASRHPCAAKIREFYVDSTVRLLDVLRDNVLISQALDEDFSAVYVLADMACQSVLPADALPAPFDWEQVVSGCTVDMEQVAF